MHSSWIMCEYFTYLKKISNQKKSHKDSGDSNTSSCDSQATTIPWTRLLS